MNRNNCVGQRDSKPNNSENFLLEFLGRKRKKSFTVEWILIMHKTTAVNIDD